MHSISSLLESQPMYRLPSKKSEIKGILRFIYYKDVCFSHDCLHFVISERQVEILSPFNSYPELIFCHPAFCLLNNQDRIVERDPQAFQFKLDLVTGLREAA